VKKTKTAIFSLILALICFGVAAVPALGLMLQDDPFGRLIFTAVWAFLGFVWLSHFRRARKKRVEE
jgi:hypothetical protein